MTRETSEVSQSSPPEEEPATTCGVTSLTAAMNAVLKAIKPLDAQVKAQARSIARRDALWETFKPLCVLPDTTERSLLERFVRTAEASYLVWLEAYEATENHKRNLQKSEQELQTARDTLKKAIEAAGKVLEPKDDKTLSAAGHMLELLDQRRSQLEAEVRAVRVAAEVTEEVEIPLAKLRAACVDFIVGEAIIHARQAALKPLVEAVCRGAQLSSVPLPVRPLEEEIVRYLSHLENNLQRQQELNRVVHPLLTERLTLINGYDAWNAAWVAALAEARADENPNKAALEPYAWAFMKIIKLVSAKSDKHNFKGHYTYHNSFSENPDSLEIHDRPRSTAVEADQIEYLRKQMRVVAFAVAHRNEAIAALAKFDGTEVTVTPHGVHNACSWSQCLDRYETLRTARNKAELETLRRATKVDLLKKTIEHFTDKAKDEMAALYKTYKAMIPRNGPTPSNELRKLLDQAAWICNTLEDRY